MKPIILITASREMIQDKYKCRYQLAQLYAACVQRAGAVPILACGGDAADYVKMADAVLFSGGDDVEPSRYGETVLNDTVSCDSVRDKEELALFSAFYAAKKPIFGICRGIQLINVALGGTLWQDIPSQFVNPYTHSGNSTHQVVLEQTSELYNVFSRKQLTVNSYHHQAVKTLGENLHVNAVSDDGMIEGVESSDGKILAVQWHPERITMPDMIENRDDMTPFFNEIVKRTAGSRL